GWWYVCGSASLTLLLVQILTGVGLALVYVPAADKAYESLLYLDYEVTLGWFLRALHYYAGSGMVVLVLAHMTQVFLHGAYKYPRELTWVLGVLLLLCTMGMFFTGQVVDPKTYHEDYEKQLKTGVPFLGDAMMKDALFSALAVIVVVALAAVLGPKGPTGSPDPTLPGANPRPEWPFLWLFALLSLSPPEAETFIILVFPLILITALFLVPFVSNRGERAPGRRPVAVLAVIVIYTALGVLTYQGATSPWSPHMTAWSSDPVPEELVRDCTPLRLQ